METGKALRPVLSLGRMLRLWPPIAAFSVLVALSGSQSLAGDPPPPTDPYQAAAQHAGVDLDLLVAIASAESGFHPYALNISGHQQFCHSRAEALDLLHHANTDDIDIGLMQINWHFWGSRSGMRPEDLLDPVRNLFLGAEILREGLQRSGTLWHRISNYHSGSPRERQRYNEQVYKAYLRYKTNLTP